MKGLEPSWIAPLEPKPSAYTNSATSTGHYTYPYACCGAIKPNILTVCNGVGQGSTLNIQRGLIPNVQDSDGPVAEWHLWLERLKFLTPPPGLEPGTF